MWVSSALAATIVFNPFHSTNPADGISTGNVANAAVASLADVGLNEYLVKDGRQFLRLGIPLGEHQTFQASRNAMDMRLAQENLELIKLRFEQVGFTNPSAWNGALKDSNVATNLIENNKAFFLQGLDSNAAQRASAIYNDILIPQLRALVEAIRSRNIVDTNQAQEAAASALSDLRIMQLPPHKVPYRIPEEYASLPRLNGRATVELVVSSKAGFRVENSKTVLPCVTFTLVLDGYHTPLTSGNFVDLVNRKYYDNLPFSSVNELTVQTGIRDGKDGFTDPKSGETRTIPLELFYKADSEPVYSITSDDDKRATDTMKMPFQAYGAVGMARGNEDVDSGSSQFFLLKWNQALVAPGRNTLDGFYTCFGYIVYNQDYLSQIKPGVDKIVSAKVIEGLDNLSQ